MFLVNVSAKPQKCLLYIYYVASLLFSRLRVWRSLAPACWDTIKFCIKLAGVDATNTAAAADVSWQKCFVFYERSARLLDAEDDLNTSNLFILMLFGSSCSNTTFPVLVFPGRVTVTCIIAFLFSSESRQQLRTSSLVNLVSESCRQVESGAKLPVGLDQLSHSFLQEISCPEANRTEQNRTEQWKWSL